jgi:hypothetical protein
VTGVEVSWMSMEHFTSSCTLRLFSSWIEQEPSDAMPDNPDLVMSHGFVST